MVQRPSVCDGSCSPVLSSAVLDHDRSTKFPVSPVLPLGVTDFNDMLPIHVLVEKSTIIITKSGYFYINLLANPDVCIREYKSYF